MQLETIFHMQEMTNREYLEDQDAEEPDDFFISLTTQGHDQATLSIKTCLLKNFRKKVIAIGHVNINAALNDEAYNIFVDEIVDGNEMMRLLMAMRCCSIETKSLMMLLLTK